MRRPLRLLGPLALSLCLLLLAAPAGATGGASAEAAEGGPEDPARTGALAFGTPSRQRPVARVFSVSPRSIVEGARPLVRLHVHEAGVDTVSARIVAIDTATRRVGARWDLGSVRTGRTLRLRWPARRALASGRYLVRLHVKDPQGATLARAASTSGKASLVVRPRPRPENPQPEPRPQPTPAPPAALTAPARGGGVFPVAGPYTIGTGSGSGFGAGRPGHTHEGHDISAPEGTPVVAPVAGTVAFVDHQPSSAGHYVVLNADDGRAMFFAHLQAGSTVVRPGQRVAAGTVVARVGSTGRSSGPHLHFEIWEGGWRDRGGRPVDPLAQLRAWAGLRR